MKFVLIFCLAFGTMQAGVNLLQFESYDEVLEPEPEAEQCVSKLKLNNSDIVQITRRRYAPENNEKYNKFMECYWKGKGYMDVNGAVIFDVLKEMITNAFKDGFDIDFSRTIAETAAENCRDVEGSSLGQKAVKMNNCLMKTIANIEFQ